MELCLNLSLSGTAGGTAAPPTGPIVTSGPSVTPLTAQEDTQVTRTQGVYAARGGGSVSITTSEWRLDGVQAGTGATYTPTTGNVGATLSYHETATETGGTAPGTVNRSVVVGVVAAAPVFAPDAFTAGMWTLTDPATDGDLAVAINSLPADGGASITDIEYRIGAGAWVSIGGIVGFTISGLTNDASVDVQLRAINSAGASPVSDTKSATPTEAEQIAITTAPGEFTVENHPEGNLSFTITDPDRGWVDNPVSQSQANGDVGTQLTTARLTSGPDILAAPIVQSGPHTEGDVITIIPPLVISDADDGAVTVAYSGVAGTVDQSDPDNITYTLLAGDVGNLTIVATATNTAGSRTVSSNTVVVNAAVVTPSLNVRQIGPLQAFRTGTKVAVHTFTQDLTGVLAGDRIYFATGVERNADDDPPATVNGQAATRIARATSTVPGRAAVYEYLMPADGAPGTVFSITFVGTLDDVSFGVVAVTGGVLDGTAAVTVEAGAGGVGSVDLTPTDAVNSIVAFAQGNPGSINGIAWSGPSQIDYDPGLAASIALATAQNVPANTAYTVGTTSADAGALAYSLIALAFSEAP